MLRLGEAIGDWRPAGGPPGDPLATIRSAWSDLVGDDVARAAQPVAIVGSALVVITASAAWSHQLAFLERAILAGIVDLRVAGIERLRFRVGTIRSPGAGGRRARGRSGPAPAAAPGVPRTAAEALARLRAAVEARRGAHRAGGGAFCTACSAAIAGGTLCRPCRDAGERARAEACERLLFEMPWLTPEEVMASVPGLDPEGYDHLRRRLVRRWFDEMRLARRRYEAKAPIDASRVRKLASSYVLLETRIDPRRLELDSPVRRNALGDLYPFIREVEGAL